MTTPAPDWLPGRLACLDELGALPVNWDSYHAPALDPLAVDTVRRLLRVLAAIDAPAPSLVPVPDGGLQLEWHAEHSDLEITVGPDGQIRGWWRRADGGITEW